MMGFGVAATAVAIVAVAADSGSPCPDGATGRISWVSEPALDGETVLLQGECLRDAAICVAGGNCSAYDVEQAASDLSSGSIMLPKAGFGQLASAGTIKMAGSTAWQLNAARPWWTLGDLRGNTSTPGGWLRLFGQNLAFGGFRGCAGTNRVAGHPRRGAQSGVVKLELTTTTNGSFNLELLSKNSTCYAAFFDIPADAQPGVYKARVSNDLPGSPAQQLSANVVLVAPEPWPDSPVFRVRAGDTKGLVAALAQAGSVGGGVVQLGDGETVIGPESLVVPVGVTLEGGQPPRNGGGAVLVTSPNTPADTVILQVGPDRSKGGRARLRDLTVRVNSPAGTVVEVPSGTWGSEVSGVHVTASDLAAAMPRGNAIGVYGDGTTVRDSYFEHGGNCTATHWPHNTAHYTGKARYLLWARNSALCRCQGYSFDSPFGLVVIDSLWNSTLSEDAEGSGVSSFGTAVAENVYFRDNVDIGHPSAAKKWETFTTDGPNGAWAGPASRASAGETTVSLPAKGGGPETGGFKPGEALVVMSGPTAGAVARLASFVVSNGSAVGATAKTAEPLPAAIGGEGSFAAVMPWRGRMAFEGNTFINGTTFQFFGAGDDLHIFNNSFEQFGTVVAWGLWYQGGYQPTLRTQWRANRLEGAGELRTLASPHNVTQAVPWVFSTVFKHNTMSGAASLSVGPQSDLTLVESNVYEAGSSPPPNWLSVDANATRVILRGNSNSSSGC